MIFAWILFIGLFPMSFVWLRTAWRIVDKKDYSKIALKKGESPKNPERFAPFYVATNSVAGIVFIAVIILIIFGLNYYTWTAIVGITFWLKIFAEFIVSRHAHFPKGR